VEDRGTEARFSLATLVGLTDERGKALGNAALVTFLSGAVLSCQYLYPVRTSLARPFRHSEEVQMSLWHDTCASCNRFCSGRAYKRLEPDDENHQVRILGKGVAAMLFPYPTPAEKTALGMQ
jgi:hypothetical protein